MLSKGSDLSPEPSTNTHHTLSTWVQPKYSRTTQPHIRSTLPVTLSYYKSLCLELSDKDH